VNNKNLLLYGRAVDSPIRPWKESLDSPEAAAMSRDLTPPKRPTGLTVVPGIGRIFLTWNENKERDLAGYYVYRSTRSGKGFKRLTNKPINRSTYSDETMTAGVSYYYAVTAVDASGNESPMSEEQKAYAETLR
jgi:fibronectin type 3 domain-containing protein